MTTNESFPLEVESRESIIKEVEGHHGLYYLVGFGLETFAPILGEKLTNTFRDHYPKFNKFLWNNENYSACDCLQFYKEDCKFYSELNEYTTSLENETIQILNKLWISRKILPTTSGTPSTPGVGQGPPAGQVPLAAGTSGVVGGPSVEDPNF